jgi:hypothetical protein
VSVIAAGAEPRRQLAMHAAIGLRRTADFTLTSSTDALGERASHAPRPRVATKLHLVADLTVVQADASLSTWHLHVVRAEALPVEGMSAEVVAGAARAVAPASEALGEFTLHADGRIDDVVVEPGGVSEDQDRTRLEIVTVLLGALSVELPRQAIGAGARWTFRRVDERVEECELVDAGGPAVRCHVPPGSAEATVAMRAELTRELSIDTATGRVQRGFVRAEALFEVAGNDGAPVSIRVRIDSQVEIR